MPKRKITSQAAVEENLRFIENDDLLDTDFDNDSVGDLHDRWQQIIEKFWALRTILIIA